MQVYKESGAERSAVNTAVTERCKTFIFILRTQPDPPFAAARAIAGAVSSCVEASLCVLHGFFARSKRALSGKKPFTG
jgi:hypothetical protein